MKWWICHYIFKNVPEHTENAKCIEWKQNNLWQRKMTPSDDSFPERFLISNISPHTTDFIDYIFSMN